MKLKPTDDIEVVAQEIEDKCIVQVVGFDDVESRTEFHRLLVAAITAERDRCAELADYFSEEEGDIANQTARAIRAIKE